MPQNIVRQKIIQRVSLISFIVNISLLLAKLAGGVLGKSSALLADAAHSASDGVTDVALFFGIKLVAKPADEEHPYGHGKIETMISAFISFALLGTAIFIAYHAIIKIMAIMQGALPVLPRTYTLIFAGISIFAKESVYQYSVRKARAINSKALLANAWHNRSDALSSVAAFIGIAGAVILGDKWLVLDPLAALVVSAMLIKTAVEIFKESIGELLEESLSETEINRIREIITSVDGIYNPHQFRTRSIGHYIAIDIHVEVAPHMNVLAAHNLSTEIEQKIKKEYGNNTLINIHIEPKID